MSNPEPRIYYGDTGLWYTPSTRNGFFNTLELFSKCLLELGVPEYLDSKTFMKSTRNKGPHMVSLLYLLVSQYNEKKIKFNFTEYEEDDDYEFSD